ncbi:halo-CC-star protein HcsL [Halostella litorea]|uniref:halo-CC-star protein HcsL n=1 Tax=Halostella litorea TaxID=2528831 RepID=UPI00109207B2|nr:halo-CC-star protein HcsL [Halostella litorea]
MSDAQSVDPAVEDALDAFTETLRESETYREFVAAEEALADDAEALALLREYREKQQRVRRSDFDGDLMSELKALRSEVADNETIQRHQAAQEALVDLLRRTDDAVSERIGEDFARSLGGGCC